jgi:3-phosphoglycerate kinase
VNWRAAYDKTIDGGRTIAHTNDAFSAAHRAHASTADRARALEIYREQGHDLNLDDELLDTLLEVVGIRAATKLRDFVRR